MLAILLSSVHPVICVVGGARSGECSELGVGLSTLIVRLRERVSVVPPATTAASSEPYRDAYPLYTRRTSPRTGVYRP